MQLVLLGARNEGSGRANPSEGCARDRGAASCVSAEAALMQIVYAESRPVKIQQEDKKNNSKGSRIKE